MFYLKKRQSVELNSDVHEHHTQRKTDIQVQSYKTDLYKQSVINMGTKLYNKMPGCVKETDNYTAFKKELKLLLVYHACYSVEEFVCL